MKILVIAETTAMISGAGRTAQSTLDAYARAGIEYAVLTASIRVTLLGAVKNMLKARRMARDCDSVHAYDMWPYVVYGWCAVVGTKKKLFITGVGTYSVAPFNNLFKRILLGIACRRASKIFSISRYTTKRIKEKINLNNIVEVYLGAPLLPTLTEDERMSLTKEFPITGSPVLLTVGQIKHRKGQLDTVRAVAKLKKDFPNILYCIVGSNVDTRYVDEIKKFVATEHLESNVLLIHNVRSDKALAYLYQRCDVFVMNSNNDGDHFEGFGLVFLEAEQFGKPVVGSHDCGIEDALSDGDNGYLSKQGDAGDIAEKIAKVLSNADELGQHSKEFYSHFSWDRTVAEYKKYYLEG